MDLCWRGVREMWIQSCVFMSGLVDFGELGGQKVTAARVLDEKLHGRIWLGHFGIRCQFEIA